jgi:ADP-heptose:LPS heptosyltransferase
LSENILFIKWKSMGDVVFTLPAVAMLRANFPGAKITYFTLMEYAPIASAFSQVDDVIALDRTTFKGGKILRAGAETIKLFRRLRRERFSMVVDTQCYAETAFLTWLTRAPRRLGFQLGHRVRHWAYTHSIPRPDDHHPVDANLKLLTQFGVKEIPVRNEMNLPEQGRKEAAAFLSQNKLGADDKLIFIQPFTSAWHKNWPLENYLAVAKACRARDLRVVFGGGPKEREYLQPAIDAGYPVCAGLPLMTVAWIVNQSAIVVGADTGLIHLAVAIGKHVLMLFKPYGGGSTGPYGHPEWIIEPPEDGKVPDIPVERVTGAIDGLLQLR